MTRFEKMEGYPDEIQGRFNSFITTQFDDSLSVEMQIRSLIKWISSSRDLINGMVDYINLFIEMFDERLQQEIVEHLSEWLADGTLAQIINNDVFDMKADKTFVDSEIERLDQFIGSEIERSEQRDEELTTQLEQIVTQVKSTGGDDTQTIQNAIDQMDSLGGGSILLPDDHYIYSSDIHVKEGVYLEGHERTRLECVASSNARIIIYNTVQLRNLNFDIPIDYNDSMFLLSNQYLMSVNRRERSSSNAKVKFENIKAFTPFNPNTPNKVAVEMFATFSGDVNATVAGYWGITGRDSYFDGFNTMFLQKTESTGWINGNVFENIVVINFEHAVRVVRSSESLGIDYNEFKLIIQTSAETKDIFKDGVSTNNYDGCQIWDMVSHTEARVGTGISKNNKNGIAVPKERYAQYLLTKRYHLIGRFSRFNSINNYVMLSITGYGNVNTDFFIRGGDEKIERRISGHNRSHEHIKFFKRELGNGEVELYLYNSHDIELEFNVYIESFRTFYPTQLVYYSDVDNLVELTNIEDYYPNTSGVYTKGENENGSWVQYVDGTMICRLNKASDLVPNFASGSIFRSESSETWTFPKPFATSSNLNVNVSVPSANRWGDISANPTLSSCSYNMFSSITSEVTSNVLLIATGYWY